MTPAELDTVRKLVEALEFYEVLSIPDPEAASTALKAGRALLAAPQAAPAGKPVAHLWRHSETGYTRIVMPGQVVTADANWIVVGPLYLHAPTQAAQTTGNHLLDCHNAIAARQQAGQPTESKVGIGTDELFPPPATHAVMPVGFGKVLGTVLRETGAKIEWPQLPEQAAQVAPADNWQQYAKPGETAQDVIERERKDSDALCTLLAQARRAQEPRSPMTHEQRRKIILGVTTINEAIDMVEAFHAIGITGEPTA